MNGKMKMALLATALALIAAGCAKREAPVQPAEEAQAGTAAQGQTTAQDGTTSQAVSSEAQASTASSAKSEAAPAAALITAEDYAKAGKFADVTALLKQDHAAFNRGEKSSDIGDRLNASVFSAYKKSAEYTKLQAWLGNESVGNPAAARADVIAALTTIGIKLDEFGFFKLSGTSPTSSIYGRATLDDGAKALKLEVIGEAGPSSGSATAFSGLYPFTKKSGSWKAVDKYFLKASAKSWNIAWDKVRNDVKLYTTSLTSLSTVSDIGGVKLSDIR